MRSTYSRITCRWLRQQVRGRFGIIKGRHIYEDLQLTEAQRKAMGRLALGKECIVCGEIFFTNARKAPSWWGPCMGATK